MKKTYEIIELDLKPEIIEKLAEYGLEKIKNDKDALVEYAAVKILEKIVEDPSDFKKELEEYKIAHPEEICKKCGFLMDKDEKGTLICKNCNCSYS
jgi:hypothetical protein